MANTPTPPPSNPNQTQQSPILIDMATLPSVTSSQSVKVQLFTKPVVPKSSAPTSADHGLKVTFTESNDNRLVYDGKTYLLSNYHAHAPGEHTFPKNAKTFPKGVADMEMHIVFRCAAAKGKPEEYAVIGVQYLFDGITKREAKLTPIDDQMNRIFAPSTAKRDASGTQPGTTPLDPSLLLPPSIGNVNLYEGSLTTDPFSENVRWIVIPDPIKIGSWLAPIIYSFFYKGGPPPRETQPRNRRYLVQAPWPKTNWHNPK